MCDGLVELMSSCWLRHPPGNVGPPATRGNNCPNWRQLERENTGSLPCCASAMVQLEISWLVWSITGADHEARLSGVGPDPVQVLAFRYASLSQDPDIGDEIHDLCEPTQEETVAAEREHDILYHAALYVDIGMCDPTDDLFPLTLLGMSRWRHDPAPDVVDN
eukprot:2583747-Pyramimonas_sp.AAC.1